MNTDLVRERVVRSSNMELKKISDVGHGFSAFSSKDLKL